jgi:hypothetical protein
MSSNNFEGSGHYLDLEKSLLLLSLLLVLSVCNHYEEGITDYLDIM